MSNWKNRDRWLALAGAILLTVSFPVAIDQGYVRYNAYLLPTLGLVACVLYIAFFGTGQYALAFRNGFVARHTFLGPLLAVTIGCSLGGVLAYGWYLGLDASKRHIATLRGDEAAGASSGKTESPTQHPVPGTTESHGTTDKVEAKAEHHGTSDTSTAKVEHPVPKATKTQAQPLVVEMAPSYGNLKQRTEDAAKAIDNFVEQRNRVLHDPTIFRQPVSEPDGLKWEKENDRLFSHVLLPDVLAVREALHKFNYDDKDLNDSLQIAQQQLQSRDQQKENPDYISLYEMEDIAARLHILANQVPER